MNRQRNRASFLALAVNKFWRMAEASLTKRKGGWVHDKSGKIEFCRNGKNEGEAVPIDVDIPDPALREVLLFLVSMHYVLYSRGSVLIEDLFRCVCIQHLWSCGRYRIFEHSCFPSLGSGQVREVEEKESVRC